MTFESKVKQWVTNFLYPRYGRRSFKGIFKQTWERIQFNYHAKKAGL